MKMNNRLWSIAGLLLTFFLIMQTAVAETEYRVKSFDTLSRLVTKFYPKSRSKRVQIMVAVLAKNPHAFSGGNIHLLLKGQRLVLPTNAEIDQISSVEAQQVLSQHTRFFRGRATGVLTIPTLNGKADREKTIAVVKKQTLKINQLEEESSQLKTQLDNLFKQKQKRDRELVQLEQQIKDISENGGTEPQGDVAQVKKSNKKLKETNEILQQKLVESKSELAENARSTMSLERKLSNLNDRMHQGKAGESEVSNTTEQLMPASTSTSASVAINEKQIPATSSALADTTNNPRNNDKYFWVLPLLLLLAVLFLLWLLARWFFGRNKKVIDEETDYEKDYASLIEEQDSIDYLNPEDSDYDESALEPSIKLDVARAYIEADDNGSAINILEEIIQEGNDEQRKEAQEILSQL